MSLSDYHFFPHQLIFPQGYQFLWPLMCVGTEVIQVPPGGWGLHSAAQPLDKCCFSPTRCLGLWASGTFFPFLCLWHLPWEGEWARGTAGGQYLYSQLLSLTFSLPLANSAGFVPCSRDGVGNVIHPQQFRGRKNTYPLALNSPFGDLIHFPSKLLSSLSLPYPLPEPRDFHCSWNNKDLELIQVSVDRKWINKLCYIFKWILHSSEDE